MNILAHIYLSGTSEEILVGNFIGDYVKGRDYKNFSTDIQKGIHLHRHIDDFTDHHKVVLESKKALYGLYGKYAGVVSDILYDHYFTNTWSNYSSVNLDDFIQASNEKLARNFDIFPSGVQRFFPKYVEHNWIKSYISLEGLQHILKGMSIRTSLPDKSVEAIELIKNRYEGFQSEFAHFFPELIQYVEDNYGIELEYKQIQQNRRLVG